MSNSLHRLTLAAAVLAMAAPAQKVGSTPPELVFEKTWNGAPPTFADFEGKVVILDFAQTW